MCRKEAKLQNIEKCSEPSLIQFRVIIWAPTITEGRGPPLEPFTLHASVRFRTRVQLPIRNGDFHENIWSSCHFERSYQQKHNIYFMVSIAWSVFRWLVAKIEICCFCCIGLEPPPSFLCQNIWKEVSFCSCANIPWWKYRSTYQ